MTTVVVMPGGLRFWIEVAQGTALGQSDLVVGGKADETEERRPAERTAAKKLWVRRADGLETAYEFDKISVSVRPGHEVAMICGAAEGVEQGQLLGALNLNTGEFDFDKSSDTHRLIHLGLINPSGRFRKRSEVGLVVGVAVSAICALVMDLGPLLLLAGGGLGVVISLLAAQVHVLLKESRGRRLIPLINERAVQVALGKVEWPE